MLQSRGISQPTKQKQTSPGPK
uniref:Uncharacterized protein n=1 Tax=Rhizophora mucronata TaxID=61149 RepID=A0A2P2P6T0_RHIMU